MAQRKSTKEKKMDLQTAIEKAINGRTLYRVAKDWDIAYPTLFHYVKKGRVPDAATAIKIADDAGLDRGEMLALMAQAEQTKKAALPKGKAASHDESILVARGGIEPPTQGFSILCSTD